MSTASATKQEDDPTSRQLSRSSRRIGSVAGSVARSVAGGVAAASVSGPPAAVTGSRSPSLAPAGVASTPSSHHFERLACASRGWCGVVRDVVEQHQPGAHRIAEVEDVEAGGRLVEAVAVAAGVEAEQARQQQAQRGLVRHHDDPLAGVGDDDLADHRQRAGQHRDAGLAALGREGERVLLPGGVLLRQALLDLAAGQPLPAAVADLAQAVAMDRVVRRAAAPEMPRSRGCATAGWCRRRRSPRRPAARRAARPAPAPRRRGSTPTAPEKRSSAVSWVAPWRTRWRRVGMGWRRRYQRARHPAARRGAKVGRQEGWTPVGRSGSGADRAAVRRRSRAEVGGLDPGVLAQRRGVAGEGDGAGLEHRRPVGQAAAPCWRSARPGGWSPRPR